MARRHKYSSRRLHSGVEGYDEQLFESAVHRPCPAACAARCNRIPAKYRLPAHRTNNPLRVVRKKGSCAPHQWQRQPGWPGHRFFRSASVARQMPTGRGRSLPYGLIYSATAPVGALAMASTISGGRPNRTFSGITSTSFTLLKPLVPRNSTTSSTRHSGAEAPAVKAIVFTPSSHSGRILRKLSIRCEPVPRLRATSTNRFEFELLSEPTTSNKS